MEGMSTDDFFNEADVVELPIEDEGYMYDANYHVRVIVDSEDAIVPVELRDRFAWFVDKLPFMEMEDGNDGSYRCSIQNTTQVRTKRKFRRLVGSMLSLIDYGVNHGATLFIRIDEDKAVGESENRLMFANVASKDVRINTKLLMGVLKEMGAHQQLSVCIKVEG